MLSYGWPILQFNSRGELTIFDASLSIAENSDFIGGIKFGKDCLLGVTKTDTGAFEFSIGGNLMLPANAPGCLAGEPGLHGGDCCCDGAVRVELVIGPIAGDGIQVAIYAAIT